MPHRIFEIDELARLISCHLVSTHPASAVSLASTCRFLEEPALSSLWELQDSLTALIGVSPIIMIDGEVTECDISGSVWHRFRICATWMRRLLLREEDDRWMKVDIFDRLLAGSTSGLVCPKLCSLSCYLTRANQPFIPHFLSPHLTKFSIGALPSYRNLPRDLLPDPTPILRALPTSCLQKVTIGHSLNGIDRLEDEISSMIQRCGDSLESLSVPLGEAAAHHVMGLKNLRVWKNVSSPPPIALPLSTSFPPLQMLVLNGKDAHGWVPWLARRERRISDSRGKPIEHAGLKATLTHLEFCAWVHIDATFTSPCSLFRNLTFLSVQSNCGKTVDCAFSLTDQDVARLSAALPRLEVLMLGFPCSTNTCRTTIACLLALSVHCKGLHQLRMHLDTTNLIGDVRSLSEDPHFRDLASLQTRCCLGAFHAGSMPFPHTTSDEDIVTIAAGFINIFPSLVDVNSYIGLGWTLLCLKVHELQGVPTSPLPELELP